MKQSIISLSWEVHQPFPPSLPPRLPHLFGRLPPPDAALGVCSLVSEKGSQPILPQGQGGVRELKEREG